MTLENLSFVVSQKVFIAESRLNVLLGDVNKLLLIETTLQPGMRKRWKRSFFCGSAKNLPLPLPHRLFDLKSNLAKKFCPFPNVD